MNIAYLTTEYPHPKLPATGGIGTFIKTIAFDLKNAGHQVTVFICCSDKDIEWFDDGIRIVQIGKIYSKWNLLKNWITIGKKLKKIIPQLEIEILEAPDFEGLHAFCKLDIPVITRIHGSVTYFNALEKRKNSKLIYLIEKVALKRSSAIVSVSKFAADKTREIFNLKKDITNIYNGVDVKMFNPENCSFQKNTILYFGTLVRKKGVLEIPYIYNELIKLNPEAKLILVGKDTVDYSEKISTWELMKCCFNQDAIKNVSYRDAIPFESMKQQIAEATVCIFPSYGEAFPLSWLEAMAMEKSIVASSIGWAKEVIEDNINGFLQHPKDHKQFAIKINELLENESKNISVGKAARNRILTYFDVENLITENIDFYKKIINGK